MKQSLAYGAVIWYNIGNDNEMLVEVLPELPVILQPWLNTYPNFP